MSPSTTGSRRRFLAPEVVQSSAMDCGPASLKCLLEGFGISVSYGRLREACQTDVDGTSIDTLENVATQLGLEAEQIMLPADHLFIEEARALPAMVVVRQPNGLTHFIIVWRRHGRLVQVMDPAIGRRWLSSKRLLEQVYVHRMPVAASGFREWAGTEEFLGPMRRRMSNLGVSRKERKRLTDTALADSTWRSIAVLDAATRMVDAIIQSGGLRSGGQAERVLGSFFSREVAQHSEETPVIPANYWSARALADSGGEEEQLLLRGAVIVRIKGSRRTSVSSAQPAEGTSQAAALSPELVAALEEPPARPALELLRLLRQGGLFDPAALLFMLITAGGMVVIEALMLRGVLDLGRSLRLIEQRAAAMVALLTFSSALLFLEILIARGSLRLGRQLEVRLRAAFLSKIPRLGDRYLRSRLTSDMAERNHAMHGLRLLPDLGAQLGRILIELILTTAGIVWLDPPGAAIAVLGSGLIVAVGFAPLWFLKDLDMRVRVHTGALSRFYLDSLLGLIPIRAHGAEQAVRREHESLLVEWARASRGLQRAFVTFDSTQAVVGFGVVVMLLASYMSRSAGSGGELLLVYWALNLHLLGQLLAMLVRQFPAHRSLVLRMSEPLGAKEETAYATLDDAPALTAVPHSEIPGTGASIDIENVTVRAGGHTILENISLHIEGGSHVAIIGASGAGKSSLAGLLLGWHAPAVGRVDIDGIPLSAEGLDRLRGQTAWIDPSVQLWNRSLIENLLYGSTADSSVSIGSVVAEADLQSVIEALPDGMLTALGEGGALVSGGEGQRVRLGRAMRRTDARLVILDEPFRGLDREKRRILLQRVRERWAGATILCITHDWNETLDFERVVVMEHGRIAEAGNPAAMAADEHSRYRAMLEAESKVREQIWSDTAWRRLRMIRGRLAKEEKTTDLS